jgi:hypothetical protein
MTNLIPFFRAHFADNDLHDVDGKVEMRLLSQEIAETFDRDRGEF